ncbi:MAG: hypothetical protein WBW75_17510 [Mycobacterium sp.]|uniref:hypothetical protein n=1 Tax=Mycobacterium sp. TaxID=1785 RepID=UPI003C53DDAA
MAHRPSDHLAPGTIAWTSPSGQPYLTRPGPSAAVSCPVLAHRRNTVRPNGIRPPGDRGVMMPKRRRTREQDRARRIDAERALNAARVAERNQPPPF